MLGEVAPTTPRPRVVVRQPTGELRHGVVISAGESSWAGAPVHEVWLVQAAAGWRVRWARAQKQVAAVRRPQRSDLTVDASKDG